jgi:hypothetical protein
MPELSQNQNSRNDEIDLLDLFRRMGKTINHWASAIGKAFLVSVVFLLRRWLPLGASIILGIVTSYLFKISAESFYSSDLVLRNNSSTNSEVIAYINKLHSFCLEDNKSALANSLSISAQLVENILDVSAFWIIDKGRDGIPDKVDYKNDHNIYDTINIRMKDRIDIRVIIKSPQDLHLIQSSIISFLKKDSLFQSRNRLRIRQNQEIISRLSYDIIQLDSLQKVKYFEETRNRKPQSGGQMIFLQEQKTQLVYSDIYGLYTRKQALETEIDIYSDIVTILSDFDLPVKPDNGTLFYVKRIIPMFVALTLIILIIIANKKKLLEIYKEN